MSRQIADRINALPMLLARADLIGCCASGRWADAMLRARPFADDAALFAAAEREWFALDPADWDEAFAAHPRIGALAATGWAKGEQAGTATADSATLEALVIGNRAYEARFGRVFLICATGRSAEDMLAELHERMTNEPAAEPRIAAAEQAKITRLRLEKLAAP